jgi:hypothetical protein
VEEEESREDGVSVEDESVVGADVAWGPLPLLGPAVAGDDPPEEGVTEVAGLDEDGTEEAEEGTTETDEAEEEAPGSQDAAPSPWPNGTPVSEQWCLPSWDRMQR